MISAAALLAEVKANFYLVPAMAMVRPHEPLTLAEYRAHMLAAFAYLDASWRKRSGERA